LWRLAHVRPYFRSAVFALRIAFFDDLRDPFKKLIPQFFEFGGSISRGFGCGDEWKLDRVANSNLASPTILAP
jgi:hypothetical protein